MQQFLRASLLTLTLVLGAAMIWQPAAQAAHGYAQCTASSRYIDSADAHVSLYSSRGVRNVVDRANVWVSHGHNVMALSVKYGGGPWRVIRVPQRNNITVAIPAARVTTNFLIQAKVKVSLLGYDKSCVARVYMDLY